MESSPRYLININGEFYDENSGKISIFDRGFLYGDSVYETTRTFERKPFRIDSHINRLFQSANKLEFNPRISKDEIKSQIEKTIQKSPHENILLRIVLTAGTNESLGLSRDLSSKDNLIIFTEAITSQPPSLYTDGVRIISYKKKTSMAGAFAKSSNYQENVMAMKKAKDENAYEALMINEDNFVTEASTSNLWLIKDGKIKTPKAEVGLLMGLTRKTIIEICEMHNFDFIETVLTLDDFLFADEVFLTSTNRDIVPVVKIDNSSIQNGKPGVKTLELLNLYRQFVKSN